MITTVPAVEKAVAILETIRDRDGGWMTIAELARQLELSKSTVHAILNTLKARGYVEQDPVTKKYGLAARCLELGYAYRSRLRLVDLFNAIAVKVSSECEETIYLAILNGTDVIYIGKMESPHAVRMASNVGTRLPAHATALGKSLLADLPDEHIDSLYRNYHFVARTPKGICDLAGLKRQLAEVRRSGYSVDRREYWEDVECVAASIRDEKGRTIAAMSIALPTSRVAPGRIDKLATLIKSAAAEMSLALGYRAVAPVPTLPPAQSEPVAKSERV
jgi:IclR family transcriptional regulator, KDG regulon repressor